MEKKMLSVRVDTELIKALKHAAVDLDRPIADLVAEAISLLLKKYEKPAK